MQRRAGTPLLVAVGIVAVGLLTGCSSGGTTTPSATTTETVTATPSSAGSSESSGSASTPSPTDGATSGSSGGSSAAGSSACATSSLAGSIEAGSGGAAGSTIVHLVLRNTGSSTCTLQGWPGVSFVGDTNGTQIGNAATLDRAAPHPTVTLASGEEAVAPLKVTNSENYPESTCDPTSPDGFRVYPPGSKQSLFIAYTEFAACRSTKVTELDVQAFVPAGQATD